jgi:hypothetical protein
MRKAGWALGCSLCWVFMGSACGKSESDSVGTGGRASTGGAAQPTGGRRPETGGTISTGGRHLAGEGGAGGQPIDTGKVGGAGGAVGGDAGQAGAAGEVGKPVCWTMELSATEVAVGETAVLTIVPPDAQQPIPFSGGKSGDEVGALISDGKGGWQYVCRSEGTVTIDTARGEGCDDTSVALTCIAGDNPPVSGDGGLCLSSRLDGEDISFGTCSDETLKRDLEQAGPSSLGGGAGGEGGIGGADGSSGEQQGGAGTVVTDCDPNGSWRIEFPNRGCGPAGSCQYFNLPPDFDLELEAPGQLTVSADGCHLHYIDGRVWGNVSDCGAVAYRVDLRIDGDSASGVLRGVESGFCNGEFRTTARAERVR